jgi:hypothetical protein
MGKCRMLRASLMSREEKRDLLFAVAIVAAEDRIA